MFLILFELFCWSRDNEDCFGASLFVGDGERRASVGLLGALGLLW